MKFSTIMAVVAVSLAFLATGCVYDKSANGGANGNGTDDGSLSNVETSEVEEGDSIDSAAGEKKFEDMYAKCSDVNFEAVYFGFDSTIVPQGELGKIDEVAKHLKENDSRVVVVEGNCDERGSNEYNVVLGGSRATIIRNHLVEGGVSADRIQTRSYGEEKPAVDGHDESAWAKNRRGEFGIYDTKQAK